VAATPGFPHLLPSEERISAYRERVVPQPPTTPADYARLGLPMNAISKTWADYENRAKTADGHSLRELLLDVADELPDRLADFEYNGLVLLGSAGVGKTLGVALLLKEALQLVLPESRRTDNQERLVTGAFVSAHAYLAERRAIIEASVLHQKGGRMEQRGEGKGLRSLERNVELVRNVDVLVLDDLGKERSPQGSGYAETTMESEVLRHRGCSRWSRATSRSTSSRGTPSRWPPTFIRWVRS
jgi:hypothetical protein